MSNNTTYSNVKIDYAGIVSTIKSEINTVKATLTEYDIKNLRVIISDEQNFIVDEDLETMNKTIYLVVHFGAASLNFGSSVCPVNIIALGVPNTIKATQYLLNEFCTVYNIQQVGEEINTIQYWSSPTVISNFVNAGSEFRSLFSVSGTFVVGQSVLRLTEMYYVYTKTEGETTTTVNEPVDFISFQDNYSNSLNPQPFYNSNGFVMSVPQFASYTFSFSTYLLSGSQLNKDMMAQKGFVLSTMSGGAWVEVANANFYKNPDATYKIKLVFQGNDNVKFTLQDDFKLSASNLKQDLKDIGTISLSFTR